MVYKKDTTNCDLHIGDVKVNHMRSVLTDEGEWKSEIWKRIEIAKCIFQKINGTLSDQKITLDTKKRMRYDSVMSTLRYSNES